MKHADRSAETRRRLLAAALDVFAADGFRNATIQKICRRAGTNIAAAHYHYGGKEGLYAAVFEHAEELRAAEARAEPPRPGATPEERLRSHVGAFLSRLLDPNRPAWISRLLAREMIDPTPALDPYVRRRMRANHEQISACVRELLGPGASPDDVRLCMFSIVAQCVFYRNSAAVIQRLYPDLVPEREVERIVDHVMRLSLGGIRGLRAGQSEAQP